MFRYALSLFVVLVATVPGATVATATATAAVPDTIRVGGPSSPADAKLAIVGSRLSRSGQPFRVQDASGRVVLRGKLRAATGSASPWRRAAVADLSAVRRPGRYTVRTGRLSSRTWTVRAHASGEGIPAILRSFDANRDGAEPSAAHGPAHLTTLRRSSPAACRSAGGSTWPAAGWTPATCSSSRTPRRTRPRCCSLPRG